MEQAKSSGAYSGYGEASTNREAQSSGVSWAAVIAGAFVAAALSLTLLALGAGFGLLSVSPWSHAAAASAVGTPAIIWLIVIQIAASGMGGYIAGRLRTKWVAIHSHEVYFRDTAHGFLAWAVAVVITAAFLGPAATAMVGIAARSGETASTENAYFVDLLFRPAPSGSAAASNGAAAAGEDNAARSEAASILADALRHKETAAADQNYLAQLVSARTGLSQNDAAQRVSDVITQARQATESERKATGRLLLWTFLSLLIGAFCASYAATIGGRQRDHMPAL